MILSITDVLLEDEESHHTPKYFTKVSTARHEPATVILSVKKFDQMVGERTFRDIDINLLIE